MRGALAARRGGLPALRCSGCLGMTPTAVRPSYATFGAFLADQLPHVDPVERFVYHYGVRRPGGRLALDAFRELYDAFCDSWELDHLDDDALLARLAALGIAVQPSPVLHLPQLQDVDLDIPRIVREVNTMNGIAAALTGRLGGDPEPRFSQDGKPRLSFSLAVDANTTAIEARPASETQWVRVTCWGDL